MTLAVSSTIASRSHGVLGPRAIASPAPDSSEVQAIVTDTIHFAQARPFIFLGLTIIGFLFIIFVLVFYAHRIIKRQQSKTGGITPILRKLPLRIVAARKRPLDVEKGTETPFSSSTVTPIPKFLFSTPTEVSDDDIDGIAQETDYSEKTQFDHKPCVSLPEDLSSSSVTVRLVTPKPVKFGLLPRLPFETDNAAQSFGHQGTDALPLSLLPGGNKPTYDATTGLVEERLLIGERGGPSDSKTRDTNVTSHQNALRIQSTCAQGSSLVSSRKPAEVDRSDCPSHGLLRRSKATFHLKQVVRPAPTSRRTSMRIGPTSKASVPNPVAHGSEVVPHATNPEDVARGKRHDAEPPRSAGSRRATMTLTLASELIALPE